MLERMIRFSLQHRILVVSLVLLGSAIGANFLTRLPIDAVPDITNNQVQINTLLTGFSPEEMEKQVTFPIENALAGIPGIVSTRSLTRNEFSQVTAIFSDDTNIYFGRNQVTERLAELKDSLPAEAVPRMGAVSTGLGEVYMWAVRFRHPGGKGAEKTADRAGWQPDSSYLTPNGERLTTEVAQLAYLRTLQDWIIRPQLKGLPGVAGIDVIGGFEKQYHVQPDPNKLRAFQLSLSELVEALKSANQSRGAGYIEPNGEAYLVRADGRAKTVNDIASIVISTRAGAMIHVSDVATVTIGEELRMGSASQDGHEAVVGTALMRIGENSRSVALAVDQKMQQLKQNLPADVEVVTLLNRSKLVNATIATVATNLCEGALLVIVVLFLMLGNVRAAVITASVIPFTLLLMSIGMVKAHISGNLMSLGALDFGLIVDGAVIIVENCSRRLSAHQRQLGRPLRVEERLAAILESCQEMVRPSVFGQAIIITVYLPILALEGVEGRMFYPMAATVITALLVAFLLSISLIPALIALLFDSRTLSQEHPFLLRVQQTYASVVDFVLVHPKRVILAATMGFLLSLWVFSLLGQEFVPVLDEKDITLEVLRLAGTGIHQATKMQLALEQEIAGLPEVETVFSKTGTAEMAGDPMPPNSSDTFIMLKPIHQWPDPSSTKAEFIERLEPQLHQIPGNNYELTQPIQMRFNELLSGVRSDLAIKIFGDDFPVMQNAADRIAVILRGIPGAAEVKVEQISGQAALQIDFNRDLLARFNLSLADVQDIVATSIGGREAGQLFEGDRHFSIVVRLADNERNNIDHLKALPIPLPSQSGERVFVRLSDLATVQIKPGLNQISRENGKRRVVVQANVRGRDIASFVAEAQNRIAQNMNLPVGYWLSWGGQFEQLEEAKARLVYVVPVCFILIYLLLHTALASARQATVVFSAVPLGLTGGVLALWIRGMPFSITAAIGFIALSGVAVLNGLVMVSRINQLRLEGLPLPAAIKEGSFSRLRPVLMTALVASLGFLPMAFASGTGAEVQKPLATVVIGGLITSTFLTLVVLPALYRLFVREEPDRGSLGK